MLPRNAAPIPKDVPALKAWPTWLTTQATSSSASRKPCADDPRLAAWPPMAATHADNARGLLAVLRRGPATVAKAEGG